MAQIASGALQAVPQRIRQRGMEDIRDPRTYAIIGAAMEVHSQLGPGFLEPVYQEALAVEMSERGIPFAREVELPILYKGRKLSTVYRADFVCYGEVLVEAKARQMVGAVEEAQVLHYLKVTGLGLGLLLNFGVGSLKHHRFANTRGR
jgi:GxxExxY protein